MAKYPTGIKKASPLKNIKEDLHKQSDANLFLLSSLLEASPHYVSGNYFAERLKMSRVGIWARVEKLRKSGLSIEASQNRGYRLASEPDILIRPLLQAWLQNCNVDIPFYLFENTDSTNSEAERLLTNGQDAPFAVMSHKQNAGRGRMGRKWHSPKGGNLYLSIALRPNVELLKFQNFTLWQGISICNFLKDHTGIENLSVKWPNDLISENKKLGGMLTEASIDCDQVRSIVFGIGLNINSSISHFPQSIKDKSTSLKEISKVSWRMHELAAKITKVCLKASEECINSEADKKLIKEWRRMDFLYGKKVQIISGHNILSGWANGIDRSGGLIIKLKNGKQKTVHSGEVSLHL